jgi:hypothetical protein
VNLFHILVEGKKEFMMKKNILNFMLLIGIIVICSSCKTSSQKLNSNQDKNETSKETSKGKVTVSALLVDIQNGVNGVILECYDKKKIFLNFKNQKEFLSVKIIECKDKKLTVNKSGSIPVTESTKMKMSFLKNEEIVSLNEEISSKEIINPDYDSEIPLDINSEGYLVPPKGTKVKIKSGEFNYELTFGEKINLKKIDNKWELDM